MTGFGFTTIPQMYVPWLHKMVEIAYLASNRSAVGNHTENQIANLRTSTPRGEVWNTYNYFDKCEWSPWFVTGFGFTTIPQMYVPWLHKMVELPTLLVTDLLLGIIQEIKMLIYARRFKEERYEIHSIIAVNVMITFICDRIWVHNHTSNVRSMTS